jgi:hypothetical protein
MRNVLGVPLGGLVLVGLGFVPAGGQAVEGTVRDADRERVLPAARIYLMSHQGEAVDSVLADRQGGFRLEAPEAGSYNLLFQMDGWATVPTEPFELTVGATHRMDFPVRLISNAALVQMGEIIRMEQELQDALPEICGEAFRPWEGGLLVGVVRSRATREPIPGARVTVATAADGVARSTVANERGTYILCNVPVGDDVDILVETPDGIRTSTSVVIRAGTASWYDLPVGLRRR